MIKQQREKKERVNYFNNQSHKDKFKQVCQKHGMIMSDGVENSIKRFVDGR